MAFSQLFSAGDSFNWDGNSHYKHALKGTNGEDDPFNNIDPFGGRAKNMIKDGTFNDTKYGVDLGGRGTNSLFDLDTLDNDGKDFSIRLHGTGPSMGTVRDIFNSQKKKTYIDVTDGNGALTEGFKELLDAAFDIGKYAAGNSFAGRVLQNGDDFVVQIAAEAHHGDDGAAEIMTFSGALAEAMHEHVTSISVANVFDEAAAVGDEFAFALDANYVESNSTKKGVSIIVQGDYDGDQVLRVINWDSEAKTVVISSNGDKTTPKFDLPADSQVFVRMGDAKDGTSYFLEGKSATSGSEIYDQPWDLTAIAADTSFDFFG